MTDFVLIAIVSAALATTLVAGVMVVVMSRRLAPLRRARSQAIAAMCGQRGFAPGVPAGAFAILGPISPRWLSNAFASPEQGAAIADFVRPEGKSAAFFSLLAFTVAGVNVPFLAVTRRNLGAMMIGGPPSVELESIDFDQRFTVRAKDRRAAVMLLDPGVMQLLLDCELVNFNMEGDRALAYVNRAFEPRHEPTEPVEFEQLFRFWDGFLARMPALVRTEFSAAQ